MTIATMRSTPPTLGSPAGRTGLRRAALRDVLTVSPGIVPFGVMLGVTAVTTGAGALAAVTGALLVFGGSAQLTTMSVLHLGAGLVAAVLSGAVVNARILLYGAALEPRFRGQPTWFRLLGPLLIQDQTYLSTTARDGFGADDFRYYWGWLGCTLLAVWTGSVGLGVLVGPFLPALPHLGLVGTALFVAMLVPRLVGRQALVAAGVSAAVALLVAHVVPELGILGGTAAGVVAALGVGRGVGRGSSR